MLKVEAGDEGSTKASKLEIIALENLKIAEKISRQMDFNISFVKIRRNETLDEQSPRNIAWENWFRRETLESKVIWNGTRRCNPTKTMQRLEQIG